MKVVLLVLGQEVALLVARSIVKDVPLILNVVKLIQVFLLINNNKFNVRYTPIKIQN